jgi:hypothetical protein
MNRWHMEMELMEGELVDKGITHGVYVETQNLSISGPNLTLLSCSDFLQELPSVTQPEVG